MLTPQPIALKGAPGSPYTRKMLAVLRYRRLPYRLLTTQMAEQLGLPKPVVELLPTFYLANAQGQLEAITDSTPLIRRFDQAIAPRQVQPGHPVLRLIDSLLEDFADEWVTKAMFHYRWHFAADADKASSILPLQSRGICMPPAQASQAKSQFSQRQIDRLAVVGSNPVTSPVIEAAYERLLGLLDAHFQARPFLLGARPGACDFAMYGQLTQLARFDPTPSALTARLAPRVTAWTGVMEDLSGLEPDDADWLAPDQLPPTLLALLREVARCYLPLLLANARALQAGAAQVEAVIDGHTWHQPTVNYQGKCLRWLRQEYASLQGDNRALADDILAHCGCTPLTHT